MTAIGETLRRERQRRNLDLETISRELKIAPKLLEAIEAEQFDRLPGGVFAKAFVRQYARYLGLDEEEMAGEIQRILQPPLETARPAERGPSSLEPIPLPKVDEWQSVGDRRQWGSTLPALALVVVVMMGCAGVYSWWQRSRHSNLAAAPARTQHTAPVTPVQPAAQQIEPSAPPPAPPSGEASAIVPASQPSNSAPPETANRAAAATPAAQTPVQTETAAQPKPTAAAPVDSATPAQAPAANQAQPANSAQPSNPNAAVRVELVANEPVWVLARSDGKFLFSGTIEANQSRVVEGNSTVLLRIGNAGGVSITLNGKPIGSVGPKGQVRTIQLTSGGFEIVAAPKPSGVPLRDLLR